jgi:hypothetical protein
VTDFERVLQNTIEASKQGQAVSHRYPLDRSSTTNRDRLTSVGKVIIKKNTPPAYGLSPGPMIVACHLIGSKEGKGWAESVVKECREGVRLNWNMLSPFGPAEQDEGGSRPRS